jgi:hypothetical protein
MDCGAGFEQADEEKYRFDYRDPAIRGHDHERHDPKWDL